MNRLKFRMVRTWIRWRGRRCRPSIGRFCTMRLRGEDDRALGPGWFDSSWDLGSGLEVDLAGPGDLGFRVWIEARVRDPEPLPPVLAEGRIEFELDPALRLSATETAGEPNLNQPGEIAPLCLIDLPTPGVPSFESPPLELVPM
jgi:hypothetical protein